MTLPIPEPDPKHPDMSPAAIDLRLRQLSQVYKLAMSLRDAKWLGGINVPSEVMNPNLTETQGTAVIPEQ